LDSISSGFATKPVVIAFSRQAAVMASVFLTGFHYRHQLLVAGFHFFSVGSHFLSVLISASRHAIICSISIV
jgi:hypothetical protein